MGKRIEEADLIRGIAILMVFLYHSIIVYPLNLHEIAWCDRLHSFLWVAEMPLFFFVSGLCFSYRGNLKEYIIKKIRRIFIPHLVFGLVDIVPRIIPNPLVNEKMDSASALMDFFVYGGSDWFLWTLFVLMVLFPIMDSIYKRGRVGEICVILIAFMAYFGNKLLPHELLLDMVGRYLVFFTIGYIVRHKNIEFFRFCQNPAVVVTGLSISFISFVFYIKVEAMGIEDFICSLGVIIAVSGLVRYRKIFKECGNWSLQMYLLNGYALVFIRTILVSFVGVTNPVVIIIINFVFCAVSCWAVSKYILGSNKLFRFISGVSG